MKGTNWLESCDIGVVQIEGRVEVVISEMKPLGACKTVNYDGVISTRGGARDTCPRL